MEYSVLLQCSAAAAAATTSTTTYGHTVLCDQLEFQELLQVGAGPLRESLMMEHNFLQTVCIFVAVKQQYQSSKNF